MKKIVCIVILILAITGLLNGISYLISGISARGIGGVNYGRVIFPLLVGAIAVYFLKKGEEKIENFKFTNFPFEKEVLKKAGKKDIIATKNIGKTL